MAECTACRSWVSELARASWHKEAPPFDERNLEPLQGPRYLPLAKLGTGAMGTVWAAYDAQLDREVALKILDSKSAATVRLQQEARALAALSHPNVVEVLDIILDAVPPAIAMELIEGPTLLEWLSIAPRSWTEITTVFVRAGHGLAAAHCAGLVHRDFKPSNVVVGVDGRAKVVDFGLAMDAESEEPHRRARAGTPAYMAPEQKRGEPASTQTDQFAWCVALHEALYGARPGAEPTAAGASDRVPQRLHRILKRGMRADAEQRWPSMDKLLGTLVRPERWRRAAGAAGVASAILLAAVAVTTPDPCAGRGESGIAESASSASPSVLHRELADHIRAWEEADLSACRGSASGTDLRGCLRRQQLHLQRASDLLVSADELAAIQLIERLPSTEECLRPAAATEQLSEADFALDAEVVSLTVVADAGRPRAALEQAEALRKRVEWQAGSVVRSRFAHAYASVLKEAGQDGTTWFEYAARAGTTGGDRRAAARAALELGGGSSPATQIDPTVSARWLARAESLINADEMTDLDGELALARGSAALNAGRYDAALPFLREAVTIARETNASAAARARTLGRLAEGLRLGGQLDAAEQTQLEAWGLLGKTLGESHSSTALALAELGVIRSAAGRATDARDDLDRALSVLEGALGPEHISIAVVATNLASAHLLLGDSAPAVHLLERVTQIEAKHLSPGRATASTWHVLGNAHVLEGELEKAHTAFSTGLDQMRQATGREHPDCATFLSSLASVALDRGRPGEAVELATESRALREAAFGSDDARLAFEDVVLAGAHLDQQRPKLALTVAQRGEALLAADPIRPRWRAELRFFRARALRGLGESAKAQAVAEAAAQEFAALGDPLVASEIRAWRDAPE